MRVIAGVAKGHKLKMVPGTGTRPISDRVKESLFNIIGRDIEDASFWDLFAGTGSVGIEALSRGATLARFVDSSKTAIATIRANLKATHLNQHAEVRRGDALGYLSGVPDREFDYIYIAPPQYHELWLRALEQIERQAGWLSDDGWVIVQIHPVEYVSRTSSRLGEFDRRRYGSTMLVFYRKNGKPEV